jgi:hypothetical protein
MPVPKIFQVRCLETDELCDAEDTSGKGRYRKLVTMLITQTPLIWSARRTIGLAID